MCVDSWVLLPLTDPFPSLALHRRFPWACRAAREQGPLPVTVLMAIKPTPQPAADQNHRRDLEDLHLCWPWVLACPMRVPLPQNCSARSFLEPLSHVPSVPQQQA